MPRLPVTLVALAAVAAGCSAPAPIVPARPADLDETRATAMVQALGAALESGDAGAAQRLGADARARDLLVDAVDNLNALGAEVTAVRFVDEDPAQGGLEARQHAAVTELTWSYAGFDTAPAQAEVSVVLEQVGDDVRVAGFGGGGRPVPLWLTDDLTVRRTPGVLVAGADAQTVRRVARLASTARTQVDAVVGDVPPFVVEVPAGRGGLDRLLGAADGEYAAIAAVTSFVGRSAGDGTPVHVFVNASVLGDLGPHGAQVVMTHELTHLATDAVHARSPLWLLEGYADHVALRETDLPVSRTARQIAGQVRADGAPAELPTAADFDAQTTHLGAVYESAWRAVEVLVAARGEAVVGELYRRTAAGESVEAALQALYDFGVEELTRRWRADLERIAG